MTPVFFGIPGHHCIGVRALRGTNEAARAMEEGGDEDRERIGREPG
jgi:hypothetical protein